MYLPFRVSYAFSHILSLNMAMCPPVIPTPLLFYKEQKQICQSLDKYPQKEEEKNLSNLSLL